MITTRTVRGEDQKPHRINLYLDTDTMSRIEEIQAAEGYATIGGTIRELVRLAIEAYED